MRCFKQVHDLFNFVLEKPVTAAPKRLSQADVIATPPDDLSQGSDPSVTPLPPPSADFTKTSVLKPLSSWK